jgi:putative transposase
MLTLGVLGLWQGLAAGSIERLMSEPGLSGATRGRARKTTIADPAAARPADVVQRRFGPTST